MFFLNLYYFYFFLFFIVLFIICAIFTILLLLVISTNMLASATCVAFSLDMIVNSYVILKCNFSQKL